MGNDMMARYAAEAQAEAKADRHDAPKQPRSGDYRAQAVLDYRVPTRGPAGAVVESNRQNSSTSALWRRP
jgi:hypothetical protein